MTGSFCPTSHPAYRGFDFITWGSDSIGDCVFFFGNAQCVGMRGNARVGMRGECVGNAWECVDRAWRGRPAYLGGGGGGASAQLLVELITNNWPRSRSRSPLSALVCVTACSSRRRHTRSLLSPSRTAEGFPQQAHTYKRVPTAVPPHLRDGINQPTRTNCFWLKTSLATVIRRSNEWSRGTWRAQ
jgi:hypothetical protein